MSLLANIYNKFFGSVKYETFILNTKPMSAKQKELLKRYKRQLIDNKIPLSKIRFVFEPSFSYDMDNDVINPIYKQLLPNNKKSPIIEIDAPRRVVKMYVDGYSHADIDTYFVLRGNIKKSKLGIVILVSEVDSSDAIYIANLDDAIHYYNLTEENYE